jgi:hypothetical protein
MGSGIISRFGEVAAFIFHRNVHKIRVDSDNKR